MRFLPEAVLAVIAILVVIGALLVALSLWGVNLWEYVHDKLRDEREEHQ